MLSITTGSTTPTCSRGLAAAVRPRAPGSSPVPSTASRARHHSLAEPAIAASTSPPNGPGSIDVIELDAATHGLVDDARDLREKAVYAPATSRYKIYIIDEAHQLGPGAANALLKLVEEPRRTCDSSSPRLSPTRSSERSAPGRTTTDSGLCHRTLQTHLAFICEQENFTADPGALALISRAVSGSVRDALSILGQLLAGSGPDGLTYDEAAEQLGVTDAALIDEVIVAMADYDGAAMFRLIDSVVEAGRDPRRFVTDLLERLRDLLIVAGCPMPPKPGSSMARPSGSLSSPNKRADSDRAR